ncbi:hypothetical protein ABKA04_000772 [Annulohypoxylon sp. FPYF3050]
MDSVGRQVITSAVLETLKGTPYEASSLEVLSGGTANFIYRHIEVGCLKALSDFPIVGKVDEGDQYNFIVRTPKFFHFDEENNSQIQEYLQGGIDLKNYALKTYINSNSDQTRHQALQLGKALGRWLRSFHGWASQQAELRSVVVKNKELQQLKHFINFQWLLDRVKQFPSILGDAEAIFREVKDMAAAELSDESQLQVVHGDFWSGNILLPKTPIEEGVDVPMFVIDWEMAQLGKLNLDLGQMIAELYKLKLYKDITAGLWIIQGFVNGYGAVSEDFAFRTAIQVGAHLISFGTLVQGWGTQEQVENCAHVGKEVIVHASLSDQYATGALRPCNRCKEQEGTIELRVAEVVCKNCFAYYVSSKAIKRLEALQRETSAPRSSGSGPRGQRRPQRYLVGLSCGPSSTALLHVLTENVRQQRARGQKTARFEYIAVHVVDDTLSPSPSPDSLEEPSYVTAYRERFPDADLLSVPLSSALALKSIDWTALPSPSSSPDPNSPLSPAQQLSSIFSLLPSATSRADVRRLLVRHILVATAARRNCDALLLGHSTTSLAELTLSETAKGRGFSLPFLVNDGVVPVPSRIDMTDSHTSNTNGDELNPSTPIPTTLPIYSPLRELFRKELLTYLSYTSPPLTPLLPASETNSNTSNGAVVSHRDLSIDDVLSRYFSTVEESYPSVVANVVRTTGKLSRNDGTPSEKTTCGLCGAGLDEQGDERWRGEIGPDSTEADGAGDGLRKSMLCYGCERSVRG